MYHHGTIHSMCDYKFNLSRMKTITIKNKEYVPVVERVKEFHKLYPNGEITTDILSMGEDSLSEDGKTVYKNDKRVVVRAKVYFPIESTDKSQDALYKNRWVTFTGHSQAVYGEGIMGDVALEIAETSAIGRALGFANIGLIDGIASADEMRKVKKVESKEIDEDLGF